jgi:cell division septation protein DedD
MRNQETGEFELVVGNRQLLSGFFIVVLLFAVAFAMGYVVGQNSPRSAKPGDTAAAAPAVPQEGQPQGGPVSAPPSAATTAPQQAADGTAQPPADAPPQPTTQPARDDASAQSAVPAQSAAAPPAESPGSYWQVGAWKQAAEGEALYQTLKDGGMPARLQPGADGLVHLMVGPYRDARSLREARDVLQTRFGVKDLFRK